MSKTTVKNGITANHWGPGIVTVENGQLKVQGHPDDPDPSKINDNIPGALSGQSRIRRPAVRESYLRNGPGKTNGERGKEHFVEVSWDKAFELITAELQRVKTEYGNNAIFAGSYGWSSAGRFHHAQGQLKRFLNSIGGFVRSEGNYSYNAAIVLLPYIVGNFNQHIKQATRWTTVKAEGELVVMFGGIPLRNAQVSGGGIAQHKLRGDLLACAEAGVEFINFSPLKTDALEELNAEWLAPKPGSDTAIMMALAHTLLTHDLYDKAFIERYSVGFDKVADYLLGKTDGVVKDAQWAAELSDIPAERLVALAHEMTGKRTLICTAVSLQRADYGEQPLWMTVLLATMLGQIGLPGGGFGMGYAADASIGVVDRPIHWPSLAQGQNDVSAFIPVAMVSDMLLNPGTRYQYNGKELTFPNIKMVWWAGGNPFHHHQDLNRLRQAFQQPETIIVNEINWTATAKHADIVLPVSSSLERNDIGAGTQDRAVIPMPQQIPAQFESRTEYEIYCELEKRLGLNTSFSNNMTEQQWLEKMWSNLKMKADRAGYDLPELDHFFQQGEILYFDDPAPDAVYLEDFRKDPQAHALKTPSGKIELYSETIAGFNYPDCPGHPTWIPPREWLGAASSEHPLHLISGQPKTRLHSQLDEGAYSKSKKIKGREPVLIHPDDARSRGISDGDIVVLHNQRGQCLAGARVTDTVRPGVVFLWTGAWYDPDLNHSAHQDRHGNPNVLTHDYRTSRLSQGPAAQSALVELKRFEGELPEVKAFEPPISESQDQ
ncbi:molybdopterin-dependent oxidoreductase [Oceanospirillum sediminis]|uniref:Molybdopterin-dependent oxidoreductase n=1 Tax=Oceanospirillum sediminis TaxID=2760088 RepID=A0A839IXP2_9GAMM|nr:molybdopterin-dependent oxidoreductase [Oceanospirillum sediminis]MBB1489147.1 molybdopterin-dependent oxidoreductase [Oceanospirillum sediminis]